MHPGEALLQDEQQRNRWERQVWLQERARALVLERELRAMRAARGQVAQRLAQDPSNLP